MKKNVLALSITAALVGIGFAGGAQAIGLNQAAGLPIPIGAGAGLSTSVDGIGQFLYVPYYTVQNNQNTMINLVNTDTVNGKAVKVRFRAAANSDDVLDFQVFLSPGDVWGAMVYKDTAKNTRLVTVDNSCTKPARGNADPLLAAAGTLNYQPFSTVRVDPNRVGDARVNETREGYVEIFNMANIPPGSDLFTSIKHVNGVPKNCNSASFLALDTDPLNRAAAMTLGLADPTTGLMANWIILNTVDAGAWSGASTAINAVDTNFNPTTGSLVYFPQTDDLIPNPPALGLTASQRVAQFTADPYLVAHAGDTIPILRTYDLPDFSIPYTALTDPNAQVIQLSDAIATTSVMNEYLTGPAAIDARTDWVLSMPTRRYSAAYDYTADVALYNTGVANWFTAADTFVLDRQICVKGSSTLYYDREERTPGPNATGVIVSPQPPGPAQKGFNICGEASVLSFNNGDAAAAGKLVTTPSGTFGATVARSTIETNDGSAVYTEGWLTIGTVGLGRGLGLPILGYEALRVTNLNNSVNYGATLPHRTNRVFK